MEWLYWSIAALAVITVIAIYELLIAFRGQRRITRKLQKSHGAEG